MLRYTAYIIFVIACVELGRTLTGVTYYSLYMTGVGLLLIVVAVRRPAWMKWVFVVSAIGLMIIGRAIQVQTPEDFNPSSYDGRYIQLRSIVGDDPKVSQVSIQLILTEIIIEDDWGGSEWFGDIITYVPKHKTIQYGDEIVVKGVFKGLGSISDEGYRSYLFNHQIYGQIEWPEIEVVGSGQGNDLVAYGLSVQHAVNKKISKLLPQDAAAFMSGVVLGTKLPLSENFSESLKATGTTHLIVASGYNISILISILLNINNLLSKKYTTILVLILVACYTFVSGLDPSIIRAALMASLGLVAMTFGRQRDALYLMMAAGTIMLLVNPFLLYDIGFQLSFAATFGIISSQGYLSRKLSFFPSMIREAIGTTLAAQIFVFPILAVTFGQISLISLATNLLVIWVIPLIMFGGALIILLSYFISPLAQVAAILLFPLIAYVKGVITATSSIPYTTLNLSGMSWAVASLYYAVIYYLYQYRRMNEQNAQS